MQNCFSQFGTPEFVRCIFVRPVTAGRTRRAISGREVRVGRQDTRAFVRTLDFISRLWLKPDEHSEPRNFRSPRGRGRDRFDRRGWARAVLDHSEGRDVAGCEDCRSDGRSAQGARSLRRSRREYLRKLPLACQWRIDIVSVYYDVRNSRPSIEVFRGASWAA